MFYLKRERKIYYLYLVLSVSIILDSITKNIASWGKNNNILRVGRSLIPVVWRSVARAHVTANWLRNRGARALLQHAA